MATLDQAMRGLMKVGGFRVPARVFRLVQWAYAIVAKVADRRAASPREDVGGSR